jgi:hypothetical protein
MPQARWQTQALQLLRGVEKPRASGVWYS